MKFWDLIGLFNDWNTVLRIKDNRLQTIIEDRVHIVANMRSDLYNKSVVSFGFNDGVMTVRIK